MTSNDLDLFESILASNAVVALDFETEWTRHKPAICTMQVAGYDGRESVVQVAGNPDAIARCLAAVATTDALLVAHYATFELTRLRENGVRPKRMVCTYVAAQVLRGAMEGGLKVTGYDLASLAARELGMTLNKEVRQRDWSEPLDAEGREYCLNDVRATLGLWAIFDTEFDLDPEARRGFDLIMDALPAVVSCNTNGLAFDAAAHKALCAQLDVLVAAGALELDILADGEIDNPNSPQQVSRWLAEKLSFERGCTVKRAGYLYTECSGKTWPMTTSGFSLDKKILEQVIGPVEEYWPEVGAFLRARMRFKAAVTLLTAFGPNLTALLDPDGRLRGRLVPHGARTSRMSCREPNLQNMPRQEAYRALFVAPKGRKLVVADYGQIELRVGCIICRDLQMQRFFAEGRDLHAATAEAIMGIPYDPKNPKHKALRSSGKGVTFASLYGAQAPTIALSSGLSMEAAAALLAQWLAIYPGIAEYRLTQPDRARADGFVTLVSGQRIRVVGSTRPAQSINAPVQGSAASVMYRAMARVEAALAKSGLDAFLCASVHDELLLDASDADARAAGLILQREMAAALLDLYPEAAALGMDGVADAAVVSRWADKDVDEFAIGHDEV